METVEISKYVKFSDITSMLESILNCKEAKTRTNVLRQYIESYRNFGNTLKDKHPNKECNVSLFPVIRLLLPHLDNERGSYGIQCYTLGKLYLKILGLNIDSEDGKKLVNQHIISKTARDYGEIVYSVLKLRCKQKGSLTLYDVNMALDNIAKFNSNCERMKIDLELTKLIEKSSALDQKWLVRIILKNLHLNMGKSAILGVFGNNAKEYYNQFTYLSKVCECLEKKSANVLIKDGNIIELFTPIRPMLCERIVMAKLEEMLKQHDYYVETKMDGERFQLHINKGEYKYFSRNGFDYSKSFGRNVREGNLTPYLADLFNVKIDNCILDGEMMVWDNSESKYRVKGENFDVKALKLGSNLRPSFCVYDILYLNGICLIDKPLAERVYRLKKVIKVNDGFLSIVKRDKVVDANHVINCLNKAFADKEEGLILKNSFAAYMPGARDGAGWYKIKPEYISGLTTDFDLLVLGGYYNRIGTFVDSYLMAVFDQRTSDPISGEIYGVAKVSMGLTDDQRKRLNERFKSVWRPVSNRRQLRCNKEPEKIENVHFGSEIPDVWVKPEDSVIIEVKASEIVSSKSFDLNYSLRFASFVQIRDDKLWHECCSKSEFLSLCTPNERVNKLTKRKITREDLTLRRVTKRTKITVTATNNEPDCLENEAIIDTVCSGKVFCILSESKDNNKQELKKIILKHGGHIVENPSSKVYLCFAGITNYLVNCIKRQKKYNIVKVNWLVKELGSDKHLTKFPILKPADMISYTDEFEKTMLDDYDTYSDSYTMMITDIEELKSIMRNIEIQDVPRLIQSEMKSLDNELLMSGDINYAFRGIFAYFYLDSIESANDINQSKLIFSLGRGIVVSDINSNESSINHIFVHPNAIREPNSLKTLYEALGNVSVPILKIDWIFNCFCKKRIVDKNDYNVKLNY